MQLKTTLLSAVLLAVLTSAVPARATEILNTTYTGWLATTAGTVSEWNFNVPNSTYDTSAGYSLVAGSYGPVKVTAPDGAGYNLQKNGGYGSRNLLALQGPSDGVGTMVFSTPAAGLTAFELGLGISGSTAPITIALSDGETFTASPAVGNFVTEGFSSGTPITSFTLSTSAGSEVELIDFYAGISNQPANQEGSAVEGATAIMIGLGLLLLGGCRKVYSNLSAHHA